MSLSSVHVGDLLRHAKTKFVGEVTAKRHEGAATMPFEVELTATVSSEKIALGETRWFPVSELEAAK